MTSTDNQWHLDKRVPIGIIAALIVQTAALLYADATWRAETGGRLDALETTVADNVVMRRKQWDRMGDIDVQQTALDTELSALNERTKAIAQQTDRIVTLLLRDTRQRTERGAP